MLCNRCGLVKPITEFTKVNRSKDGSKGLCKECKKEIDKQTYKNRISKDKQLHRFELIPDMLVRRKRARIGVLQIKRQQYQRHNDELSQGLKIILSELQETYDFCEFQQMNDYEYVLCSFLSVTDIEDFIYCMEVYAPANRTAKVVVGGFGIINIKLLVPYIDIAIFGRGEGQINEVLSGIEFSNVWRKERDPFVEAKYVVRQPRYLCEGEVNVGCRNKCLYCQYTWTRKQLHPGEPYSPGMDSHETDWHALSVGNYSNYVTAWDGWSEETRRKVNKRITDQDIQDKLIRIGNTEHNGSVFIKIYQIVGYPWETVGSVMDDIAKLNKLIAAVDKSIQRKIKICYMITPFGPEPLTPMQYKPANIDVNWNAVFKDMQWYKGYNITTNSQPFIMGPFALMKRVFVNRARLNDIDRYKQIVYSSRLNRMKEETKVDWLLKYKYISRDMFSEVQGAEFDYLSIEKYP